MVRRRRYSRRSRRRRLPPYVRAARIQALNTYGSDYRQKYAYGGYYDRAMEQWLPKRTYKYMDPETGTKVKSIDYFGETWGLASDIQKINRRRHGYYGRGDYGLLSLVPKAVGLIGRGIRAYKGPLRS